MSPGWELVPTRGTEKSIHCNHAYLSWINLISHECTFSQHKPASSWSLFHEAKSNIYICIYLSINQNCQWTGVHKRISLMDLFLFLQQCPACIGHLTWMVCEMRAEWLYSYCFVGCASRISSRQHASFSFSSHQAFFWCALLASMWCIYIVVWTLLQLGRNPILFHRTNQTSINW